MDTLALGTLTFTPLSFGCAAGTTTSFTTATTRAGVINGKFTSTLAAGTDAAITPTSDLNTGAAFVPITPNKCAAVVFGIIAAGTLAAVQGPLEDTYAGVTTTVGAFKNPPQFPPTPDTFCPIAYTIIRVAPSGGNGFVVGTTQWAASSMSAATFQNVATLPARPQIA